MKKYLLLVLTVMGLAGAQAQMGNKVSWTFSARKLSEGIYEVHLKADIADSWHLYSQNVGVDGAPPTTVTFTKNPLLTLDGKTDEKGNLIKKNEEVWGGEVHYFEGAVDFVQKVKVKGKVKTNLIGKLEYVVCNDRQCLPPAEVPFSVNIGG